MTEVAAAQAARLQAVPRRAEAKGQIPALIEIEDRDTREAISEESLKRYQQTPNFSSPTLTQK